ncbi:ATP-binding protein [Paenibacillus sp. MBLB4367]|uniref:HAMP domain-containing sensor histidine kinase n=1 Tax=Paenibacillus sp. MBLB4367 TaxID=3384767 RepID=UPI0039082659
MKLNIFPFNWFGDLTRFAVRIVKSARINMQRSVRLQLIFTFAVCVAATLLAYSISNSFLRQFNATSTIQYNTFEVENMARELADYIRWNNRTAQELQEYINSPRFDDSYKIMFIDPEGKVVFKNGKATETQVDVHSLVRNAMERSNYGTWSRGKEVTSFYPVEVQGQKGYMVISGVPEPYLSTRHEDSSLALLAAAAAFIFLFYWMTKRKMRYIEELAQGLMEISRGNLNYRVEQRSKDELGTLASHINHMTGELQRTIEEERRAERTKNELITNVSHDLRTPLTLIMGYLRLLKDKNFENEQQADAYVNIAFGKSEKLKGLIDDLFDYTKLSNHDIRMHQERVCLNELLEQLSEELVGYAEENELKLRRILPSEKLMVTIDADKMIRVFENLLTNAVKYSLKPGVVTVAMTRENEYVRVCVTNFGDPISKEELPKLFDRFYRVDASRTSATGGTGLGLAIAKSIVDAHNGEIWAESEASEIRFCVRLKLA